jgi:hypothetical protein
MGWASGVVARERGIGPAAVEEGEVARCLWRWSREIGPGGVKSRYENRSAGNGNGKGAELEAAALPARAFGFLS